jgi:hypothetical protein
MIAIFLFWVLYQNIDFSHIFSSTNDIFSLFCN